MKKIATLLSTFALLFVPLTVGLGSGTAVAQSTHGLATFAASSKDDACAGAGGTVGGSGDCTIGGDTRTVNSIVGVVISFLSYLAGAIAVIMIIVAGIRYVTSGGDSNSVAAAKNTLIYAIVGIVVAVLAQVITRFAFSKATK